MDLTTERANESYYGHGKLLLSGEYFVLDGALALALPTNLGQYLKVGHKYSFEPKLHWKSFDSNSVEWFNATFEFWRFDILDGETPEKLFLQKVLRQARLQNPHFLRENQDVFVETKLEFPLNWGLGSSSTLIYNVAKWAYISPFELQFKTMGGSGYDIACAQSEGPILYEKNDSGPNWSPIEFDPPYKNNLYFIYLGKKADSREGIRLYNESHLPYADKVALIHKLSIITKEILQTKSLENFEFLIKGHEEIVAQGLGIQRIKDQLFKNYWGEIKSLGAWGGDFILATSDKGPKATIEYFQEKGLGPIFNYSDLIFSNLAKANYGPLH